MIWEPYNSHEKLLFPPSWIRDNLYYYSHPTGTARLDVGRYDESVVGKDLLVQGIPNLRICDASVIGKSVVGHSDAPTRMVGANCAKMIFDGQNAEMPYSGYGTNLPLKAFHIQYYLQAGGRLIDTAASYQNEQVVAVGMGQSEIAREKIFLVTKIGPETFDDTYTAVKSHLEKFQGDDKYGKFQKVGVMGGDSYGGVRGGRPRRAGRGQSHDPSQGQSDLLMSPGYIVGDEVEVGLWC